MDIIQIPTTQNPGAGLGDVVGPASATDNAIVRYDATTGRLLQNSTVTIADSTGAIAGATSLTSPAASNLTLGTGTSGAAITVLSASNNVGIGTTTPSVSLEIKTSASTTAALRLTDGNNRYAELRKASSNNAIELYNSYTNTLILSADEGGTKTSLMSGNVLIGTTSDTGLTGVGGLKINSSTAGSAGAGALVIEGGLAAGGASYFGGAVTAMIAGTRTGINDDSVATFTPLVIGGVSRGLFVILNTDYSQSIIGGYFSSGANYLLYTIVKSADVTITNSTTMTGTTGTDGKMNIGFNNGIIYIENRLGGSANFLYLPFGGTS